MIGFYKKLKTLQILIILLSTIYITKFGLPGSILSDTSKVDSIAIKLRLQVERFEKEKQYNFRDTKLYQAQCLCQGETEDGLFDQKTIDEIIFALDKIQIKYPHLKNIKNRGGVHNYLYPIIVNWPNHKFKYHYSRDDFALNFIFLGIKSDVNRKIYSKFGKDTTFYTDGYKRDYLGIKSIDDLNRKYGAYKIRYYDHKSLWITFKSNIDIIRSCERYMQLDEVTSADRNELIVVGNHDEIRLIRKENIWYFLFFEGSSAECFYVIYSPSTKEIREYKEISLSTSNYQEMIWRGLIQSRHPIKPFDSYAHLIKAAKSDNWWEKLYALDVLGYLQLQDFVRYGGDNFEKVEKIRQDVRKNEIEVIGLLLRNLENKDRDISKTAYTYLRLKSGENYSLNDVDKWKNWFLRYQKQKSAPD